ncbi:MAG: hypothetical protein JRG97_13780 [Deltaproteobacteria bacterium]|nr:hypothetical protein [Deltaproteobacteria bacterium]MBW2053564.1 hypothetical protein [Deltaproteobacteria bacterium]MBW2142115.1 hypothetical protein [Deltaproteobacteria bacterium]MBW2324091.1 hypothetical protein [Deltaproteobacteria bacterium]
MARIKIKDLPVDKKISQREMKKVLGGVLKISRPSDPYEKEADGTADLVMQALIKLS